MVAAYGFTSGFSIVMKIHVPKGVRALDIRSMSRLSYENEILINVGSILTFERQEENYVNFYSPHRSEIKRLQYEYQLSKEFSK